jgi:DNA-binding CsgD family transcriptional regulator
MRGLLGAWWLGQGDAKAAAQCLDRSITIEWRIRPIVQDSALIFPVAIEALALAGRPEDARALATEIGRRTRRWEARMFRAGMARATALLAMVEGRPDKAATLLRPWLEGGELADLPFLRARAELVLGQVLRRQRHRSQARAMLEQARDRFRALGAVAWTERAEEQLARLGDRPGSAFGLTATEQRIAALAVAGKTNRAIADTLVVSVKTVEWNLTKVYEKVGVRSRSELAARFVGDGALSGEAGLEQEAATQQASARLT